MHQVPEGRLVRATGSVAVGGIGAAPPDLTVRPWDRGRLADVEARNTAAAEKSRAARAAYLDAAQGKGTTAPKPPRPRAKVAPKAPTPPRPAPSLSDTTRERYQQWRARYEAGETSRQIGDSLGIPAGTIRGGLAAVGTVMRHRTARTVTPDDVAAIVAAYRAGESVATIARRHRIGNERTAEIIRATGTPLRRSVHMRGAVPLDPDDVTRLYRAGHTTRQIANRYGACTKRVAAIITAAGAMRPSRGARP